MAEASSLPPSAKYILDVVEQEGAITRQQLLARTTLPTTTLDRAVRTLQNEELLVKTRESSDMRQVVLIPGRA